jgi:hypothetical protein
VLAFMLRDALTTLSAREADANPVRPSCALTLSRSRFRTRAAQPLTAAPAAPAAPSFPPSRAQIGPHLPADVAFFLDGTTPFAHPSHFPFFAHNFVNPSVRALIFHPLRPSFFLHSA